jgi:hypothetical protein
LTGTDTGPSIQEFSSELDQAMAMKVMPLRGTLFQGPQANALGIGGKGHGYLAFPT